MYCVPSKRHDLKKAGAGNMRTTLMAMLICTGGLVAAACGPTETAPSAPVAPVVEVAPPVEAPKVPVSPEAGLPTITVQRINDLEAIANAVKAFKLKNGVYPNSGNGYAAYKMSWGQSKGDNWIPELVPEFLEKLPRDPAKSEDADGPQYLYASDGAYFKVIAHYTGDCDDAVRSPRVSKDPVRTKPDGTCWAFGIWSDNGKDF